MSLADELAALTAASQEFDQNFGPKLEEKVETTKRADTTETLVGQNQSQVAASLLSTLNVHIARPEAHNLTIGQIGGLTKAEIDAKLAGLPSIFDIPISRYGDLGYLPVGVVGSFEGATTNDVQRNVYMFLENDGALVYLRNGVNGSKSGVYYAHLKNDTGPMSDPVKTNRRYQPSFFPVGQTAAYIESGHSNPSVLVGRLQNVQGELQNYFVSLTNGTLDDSVHSGGFITPAVHTALGLGRGVSFISNGLVWFLTPDTSNGLQLRLATAPVAAFTNGAVVAPTVVTGITCTGFGGVVYAADGIKLAAAVESRDAADKPVLHSPQLGATGRAFHYDIPAVVVGINSSGMWRIKVSSFSWGAYGLSAQGSYMAFTLLYNPNTKVATLETEFQPQSSLTFPNGVATLAGPNYDWNVVQEGDATAVNSCASYCYNGKTLFTYRQFQGSDFMSLAKATYQTGPELFDRLKRNSVTHVGNEVVDVLPNYGSAAGSDITATQFVTPELLLFHAKGRRASGAYGFAVGYTSIEGTADYNYNSLSNGPMKGYRPSSNRGFLEDHGIVDPMTYASAGVTEVSGATLTYSTLRFHSGRLTGQNKLNGNFVSDDGTTTLVAAALQQAGQTAIALTGLSNVETFTVELVVPRLLAGSVPAFAVICYKDATSSGGFFIAEVTLNYSGATITGATATKVSPRAQIGAVSGLRVSDNAPSYLGGYSLYLNGNDALIGGTVLSEFWMAGGAPSVSVRFRYNVSTKQWTWPVGLGNDVFHYNAGYRGYAAHPTLGFGKIHGTDPGTDYGTKSVFVPIGTTATQFDQYAEPAVTNWRILVSQDVAEGWMLYFTEHTPILFNGVYYAIPPTSVDLAALTQQPSNKVFYVYAVRATDAPVISYDVSLSKLGETSRRMYLGYIATGASSIETLALEKVTQIAGQRLSQVSRGDAIAVTGGPVADPATLPWS